MGKQGWWVLIWDWSVLTVRCGAVRCGTEFQSEHMIGVGPTSCRLFAQFGDRGGFMGVQALIERG